MRNSVTMYFTENDVPTVDFEKDNDMVTLYWGSMEIYMHQNELKYLAERIDRFLKEKEHVVSKR